MLHMKYYTESADAVLAELKATADGLDSAEVQRRQQQYGPNRLKEGKKVTLLERFLNQLKDPMIIILLAAAAISGVTSVMSGESFADVIIILIVVLINAVLGVYQENKAEKSIEALQQMTAATCKVLRDGRTHVVKNDELVPGDVVLLEAGDAVPADGRILESASMQIEEAALTGESVPVHKAIGALGVDAKSDDVPLGDRKNMCYMGSTVTYGRGTAVITATGMDTEMGKIADALARAEQGQTPPRSNSASFPRYLLGLCSASAWSSSPCRSSARAASVLKSFSTASWLPCPWPLRPYRRASRPSLRSCSPSALPTCPSATPSFAA